MFRKISSIYCFLVFLTLNQGISQSNIEQRLNKLETRLDSLINALEGQTEGTTKGDTIHDDMNLQYGIICSKGTILDKGYFIINHNDDWKIPYWVAHRLTAEDLIEDREYSKKFEADTTIPEGRRAEPEDYKAFSTTFDQGHLAPNADFVRSKEAMASTFVLSNVSPQYRNFNRGIWQTLEKQVREMIEEKSQAWLITGNAFISDDSLFVSPREWIGRADSRLVGYGIS